MSRIGAKHVLGTVQRTQPFDHVRLVGVKTVVSVGGTVEPHDW